MNTDIFERRRAVEERLARVKGFARSLEEAAANVAAKSGVSVDDLDPHGDLRAVLPALAGAARARPGFDVMVALVDSPFALRVRHLSGDVDLELLRADGADAAGSGSQEGADPGTHPGTGPATEPGSQPGSHPDGAARPADARVASDLAAVLWQDLPPPLP